MSVPDLVNRMLEAAPRHDANGFLRVLKLAQAILDEKHVPYPRVAVIPVDVYQTLSAAGAKFLETPNAPAAAGSIYGFHLVIDQGATVPRYETL